VRLRRADCSGPGITRRRAGRGFVYLDEDGERVSDPEVLRRIRELAIPPAWEGVWICPYPNGHLQATGTDAAGRKQYRYHDAWRTARDREKFTSMEDFARALPALRRQVLATLSGSGELDRQRVLACAVRLLDVGFFRIGSEDYAVQNETYGLATMRKEHVRLFPPDGIEFDYPAKSGQRHERDIVDPAVFEVVATLKRRRGGGDELLAWRNGRRWCDVRSPDINAYVKETTGGEFTAKDFRTWNATVLAAQALAVSGAVAGTKTGRTRAKKRAVDEVAAYLNNTPAVCRASYIDPRVFDAYDGGTIIAPDLEGEPRERAVLDLITERDGSRVLEQVAA
jgi:DNA topoisomerase I